MLGDLVTRKKLSNLDPSSFSSILILADESATGVDIADADSRSLASLLLLTDLMKEQEDESELSETKVKEDGHVRNSSLKALQEVSCKRSTIIISEILDSRTRNLIQDLNISEFVMSNELVSMALAMVSESADVNVVLGELFSENGNELYCMPVHKYMQQGN